MSRAILYRNGGCYVVSAGLGHYVVYRPWGTAAAACGTFHFPNNADYAFQRAVTECDRRAGLESRAHL